MDTPSAPDPADTAAAQGAANKETAIANAELNRYNQKTPYGDLTWTQQTPAPVLNPDGTPVLNADGTPKLAGQNQWTSTQTLTPQAQAILDNQMAAGKTLSDTLNTKAQQATAVAAQPPASLGQAPDAAGIMSATRANVVDPAKANLAAQQSLADQYRGMASNLAGTAQTAAGQYGANAAMAMSQHAVPQVNDAYRDQVTSALYNQSASRLNPQWSQAESDLEAKLAAQGITHGSEAYNRDYQNQQRAKTDAYQTATNAAIAGGTAAQQAQFDMGLNANKQAMQNAADLANNPMNLASAAQNLNASQQYNVNAGLSGLLAAESAAPGIANSTYGYENQGRLQEYTDQNMQLNNLLSQLATMTTGTATGSPSFINQNTGVNVANTDVAGINNNAYNASAGTNNSLIGAAGMLGAAGIGSLWPS